MIPEKIIDIICSSLELDKNTLCGIGCRAAQNPEYVEARNLCVYFIRKIHGKNHSYRVIAKMVGRIVLSGKNKGEGDHTSAIYSEWICKELLKTKDKKLIIKHDKIYSEISKTFDFNTVIEKIESKTKIIKFFKMPKTGNYITIKKYNKSNCFWVKFSSGFIKEFDLSEIYFDLNGFRIRKSKPEDTRTFKITSQHHTYLLLPENAIGLYSIVQDGEWFNLKRAA